MLGTLSLLADSGGLACLGVVVSLLEFTIMLTPLSSGLLCLPFFRGSASSGPVEADGEARCRSLGCPQLS